ncbi:hypothetical protein OY671_002389 [Metschnikowia pulcherrima]|nr:hypothetical protein OY671_002389 [Metschnikowia pulcherrima]
MSACEWKPDRSHDNFTPDQRAQVGPYYRHRPMLRINKSKYTNGPQLSIMTYNILSPCTKEQYPISHFTREQIILFEIVRYNPDIVCLQEVNDHHRWIERFAMFGYNMRVFCPNEFHAVAIAYKWDLFQEFDHKKVHFRRTQTGYIRERRPSSQGALFLCLTFKPEFLIGRNTPTKDAIIIGTAHLPSTGVKAFGRTRDTIALFDVVHRFARDLTRHWKPDFEFYSFIAGDFNATPEDPAYQALVTNPVKFTGKARKTLLHSIAEDASADLQGQLDFSFWSLSSQYIYGDRLSTRDYGIFSDEWPDASDLVEELEGLLGDTDRRALSLYSAGYKLVDKENTQLGSDEPFYSYWGKYCRQLVDYIFVVPTINDWEHWVPTKNNKLKNIHEFSQTTHLRILALLQMPSRDDPELQGIDQPNVGQFPSDHICMMADLELL